MAALQNLKDHMCPCKGVKALSIFAASETRFQGETQEGRSASSLQGSHALADGRPSASEVVSAP